MEQTFTFGQAHRANDGTRLANRYVIIEGEDSVECREKMFRLFGPFWAFQYDTPEEAGAGRWGLREYVIPETQIHRHDIRECDDNCTGAGLPYAPCECACHHDGTEYDRIDGKEN